MDDGQRRVWQMMGFHNALREADAQESLSPDELDAMPLYDLWRRVGLHHVTLADAVAERRRMKGE